MLGSADGGSGYVAPVVTSPTKKPTYNNKPLWGADSDILHGGLPVPPPPPMPPPVAPSQFAQQTLSPSPTGQYVASPAPPPTGLPDTTQMSPEDWLTKDEGFLALQNRLRNALTQFDASKQKQDSLIDTNATEQNDMYNQGRGTALDQLLARMASHGTVNSTGYGDFMGDTNKQYDDMLAKVAQNQGLGHQALIDSRSDLVNTNTDLLAQGRADALNRRLAAYGLTPGAK